MKRLTSIVLALSMCLSLSSPALAADDKLIFNLSGSVDGSPGATAGMKAKPGDVITVTYKIYSRDGEEFRLDTIQNEIMYSTDKLEYVEDSVQIQRGEGYFAQAVAGPKIYMNDMQPEDAYEAVQTVGTFELLVTGQSGNAEVKSTAYRAADNSGNELEIDIEDLKIEITTEDEDDNPSGNTPSDDNPSDDTPNDDNPSDDTPNDDNPSDDTPNDDNPSPPSPPSPPSTPSTPSTPSGGGSSGGSGGGSSGGSSGGGSGGGGGGIESKPGNTDVIPGGQTPTPPADTSEAVTVNAEKAEIKNGVATVPVSADAVKKAVKDAGASVKVVIKSGSSDASVPKVSVEIPAGAVADVAGNNSALSVETQKGNVSLPAESMKELSKMSGDISVSVGKNADNSVVISVAVGGADIEKLSGGVIASVPADSGNVLAVVGADGKLTIIQKSMVENGSAVCLLDGSCTVKIVDNKKSFADTAGHWGAKGIDFVSSHELFNGTGENSFEPDGLMNRGMLATVLHRLEGKPESAGSVKFNDVQSGAWYEAGVSWAAENGVVTGYGEGLFGNEDPITREQLATMLYRYSKNVGVDISKSGSIDSFSDGAKVSNWAKDAVKWAVGSGLLNGTGGGSLDPAGNATRAQVAAISERLVGLMLK